MSAVRCTTCNDRGFYEDSCGNPDQICTCIVGQSLPRTPADPEVARQFAARNAEIDRLATDHPALTVKRIPLHPERNSQTGKHRPGYYGAVLEDGDVALLFSGQAMLVIEPSETVVKVTSGRERDPVKQ